MDLEAITEQLITILTTYGLNVLGAIAILIAGWIAAGWAKRATLRIANKSERMDATVAGFLSSIVRYGVLTFTVLAVLSQFGIETTSIIAVLGALGLAIGLALQGTLGHVASGVMLLLFRPFKVGDFVETGGESGTVKGITLFTTELATPDNVQIIIPNGEVWGAAVKNYSFHDTRRVDLVMGIGYNDDIDKAIDVIQQTISADSRAMTEPAPQLVVGELADSSVNIIVRVWTEAGNYWPLKFDLTKTLKERFDAEGIEIPYPQRVVHQADGQDDA
ncbi:MAG: mechanosensitive ion channel family protein [Alphaproteobacteria bacterium]